MELGVRWSWKILVGELRDYLQYTLFGIITSTVQYRQYIFLCHPHELTRHRDIFLLVQVTPYS